jgi:hypothetical protein
MLRALALLEVEAIIANVCKFIFIKLMCVMNQVP